MWVPTHMTCVPCLGYMVLFCLMEPLGDASPGSEMGLLGEGPGGARGRPSHSKDCSVSQVCTDNM